MPLQSIELCVLILKKLGLDKEHTFLLNIMG